MKNNENPEEKPGLFSRFSEFLEKISEKLIAVKETKLYTNAAKIFSSKGFSRVVGLATLLAGATAAIATAPILFAWTVVSFAAAAAIDVYVVGQVRKVFREAKLLKGNKAALDKQGKILEKNPKLQKILKDKLKLHDKKNIEKDKVHKKTAVSFLGGVGTYLITSIAGVIKGLSSTNPLTRLTTLAGMVSGIKSEGEKKQSVSEAIANLNNVIEKEKKDYPLEYKNPDELREQVNKQRIQTMTLEKLSKTPGLDKMNDKEIQNKFDEIQGTIVTRANILQKSRGGLARFQKPIVPHEFDKEILDNKIKGHKEKSNRLLHAGKEIGKNIVKTHDPFSKYNDVSKLHEKLEPKEKTVEEKKELVREPKKTLDKNKNAHKNQDPKKQKSKKRQNERSI